MPYKSALWCGAVTIIIAIFTLTVWPQLTLLNLILNPILLWILIVSIRFGLPVGFLTVAVAGLIYQAMSVITGEIVLATYTLVILCTWAIRRRWLTTHSTLSLIAAISFGSGLYYLLIFICVTAQRALNPLTLVPLWAIWFLTGFIQLLIHPLLGWIIFRLTGTPKRSASIITQTSIAP